MALQKSIITGIGIEVNYHVLSAVHWYPHIPSAHIDISSYVSQTAYAAGALPVVVNQFEFIDESYPFTDDAATAAEAYAAVLTTDMFSGAAQA